jgi:hypothetical protein
MDGKQQARRRCMDTTVTTRCRLRPALHHPSPSTNEDCMQFFSFDLFLLRWSVISSSPKSSSKQIATFGFTHQVPPQGRCYGAGKMMMSLDHATEVATCHLALTIHFCGPNTRFFISALFFPRLAVGCVLRNSISDNFKKSRSKGFQKGRPALQSRASSPLGLT